MILNIAFIKFQTNLYKYTCDAVYYIVHTTLHVESAFIWLNTWNFYLNQMLKALQSTLTAKNNIQYRYERTKLKHMWLYVKKHHYTGMSLGCPWRWSLTSGFSNSVEENSTGLALHEQRPVLPTISLKPELAKDRMWRILWFVMVGSCELKIYCSWGKFR